MTKTKSKQRRRQRAKVGDVFEIVLPDGRYAYGRVYRDVGVGIYRQIAQRPNNPPIGSREFLFHVGMYRAVLSQGECQIVGRDPFPPDEEDWPPPKYVYDVIGHGYEIYHRGTIRHATKEQCKGLEPASVWDLNHIVDRILNGKRSKYWKGLVEEGHPGE